MQLHAMQNRQHSVDRIVESHLPHSVPCCTASAARPAGAASLYCVTLSRQCVIQSYIVMAAKQNKGTDSKKCERASDYKSDQKEQLKEEWVSRWQASEARREAKKTESE